VIDVRPLMPEIDFAVAELPDLHEVLARLREQGPVSPILFAGQVIWLVNDYATVKQVIADDEYLSAPESYKVLLGQSMGNVLATMTGAQHRLNRAVVANVFFPKKMRQLADSVFADEAARLAESLRDRRRVELVSAYNRRYTFNNITRLLGLPRDDVVLLQDWAERIMHSYIDLDSAREAGREMGEYLMPLVAARRGDPQEDVISLLIEATVDGEGLSDEEILAFCRNLFPAAIDTSTNSLGSLVFQALRNPGRFELLSGDPKAVDAAIDEMLRLEPPLVMIPRKCVKALELGGRRIAVGDDVRLCITGANLDPAQFERPHVFDPERDARSLTFGHGEHFCLGSHMARRVLETGVKTLLQRFPDMRLCADKPVQIIGGVLRGPRELWVEPHG